MSLISKEQFNLMLQSIRRLLNSKVSKEELDIKLSNKVNSVNGSVPDENGNVQIATGEGTVKFMELEMGKTVYHAVVKLQSGAYGVTNIQYLPFDIISDYIVAEAAGDYELTLVHTDNSGVKTTYNGKPTDSIHEIYFHIGDDRKFSLKASSTNSSNQEFFKDNGSVEVIIKTPAKLELALSPHNAFVGKEEVVSKVNWESELSGTEQRCIPTSQAVQDGLQIFGQTYTAYTDIVSTEPVEVVLENRTYYDFDDTPKITVNRSKVSTIGSYCCFRFHCGDTPTELLDAVDQYDNPYNWPAWRMQGAIKPNRAYRCIIHQGIPFLEECTLNDTNMMTTILKEMGIKVTDVDCNYWVPTNMQSVRDAYAIYSHLYSRIGVDSEEFQQAFTECKLANDSVMARSGYFSLPYTVHKYIAVGGETYRTTKSSSELTATEGLELIKLTIPPASEYLSDTNMDNHLLFGYGYLCVYNGKRTSLTTGNDTYAIKFSTFPMDGATLYFKPSTNSAYTSFNTITGWKQYDNIGSTLSSTKTSNGTCIQVRYNDLEEG